jgi:c-di-GMP-binding flagellar brake protein YcgR
VSALDRRLDRRKKLPDDFYVELHPQDLTDGGPPKGGRAADLTMGGMGVVLPEPLDHALQCEVWTVSFALPDKSGRLAPLQLNCLVTHGRLAADGHFYGLRFQEINAPARSAERAALRQFLLSDLRDQWQGNLMIQAPSVTA